MTRKPGIFAATHEPVWRPPMKLETSEEDVAGIIKRFRFETFEGGTWVTLRGADVEIAADYMEACLAERAPPLPAEVEEMRKRLDAIAENYADVLGTAASEHLRAAASLLSRLPVGFFAGLSEEQKKAALEYRGPENFGEPDAPLLPEPPHE